MQSSTAAAAESPWFSEEDGGESKQLGRLAGGWACDKSYCDTNKIFSASGFENYVWPQDQIDSNGQLSTKHPSWTGYSAKDKTSSITCPEGTFVKNVQTIGSNAERFKLNCKSPPAGLRVVASERLCFFGQCSLRKRLHFSAAFSEEKDNGKQSIGHCPANTALAGLMCKGTDCDVKQLICVGVEVVPTLACDVEAIEPCGARGKCKNHYNRYDGSSMINGEKIPRGDPYYGADTFHCECDKGFSGTTCDTLIQPSISYEDWHYVGYWKKTSGGILSSTSETRTFTSSVDMSEEKKASWLDGLSETSGTTSSLSLELSQSFGVQAGAFTGGTDRKIALSKEWRSEATQNWQQTGETMFRESETESETHTFTITQHVAGPNNGACTDDIYQWFLKGTPRVVDGHEGEAIDAIDVPTKEFRCIPRDQPAEPACPPEFCGNVACTQCTRSSWFPSDAEIAAMQPGDRPAVTRADIPIQKCTTDQSTQVAKLKVTINLGHLNCDAGFACQTQELTTCEQAAMHGLCAEATAEDPNNLKYVRNVAEYCPCWCADTAAAAAAEREAAAAGAAAAAAAATTTGFVENDDAVQPPISLSAVHPRFNGGLNAGQSTEAAPEEAAPEEADACCEDSEDVQCVACSNPGWSIQDICAAYPGQYVGCGSADDADADGGGYGYGYGYGYGTHAAGGDSAMHAAAEVDGHKSANGRIIAGVAAGAAVLLLVVGVLILVSSRKSYASSLSNAGAAQERGQAACQAIENADYETCAI